LRDPERDILRQAPMNEAHDLVLISVDDQITEPPDPLVSIGE
jgi:hypothetical protein